MRLLFSYSAFRILRWELVSKRDGYGSYTTSIPRTGNRVFSQCCRWFTGSFLVAIRSTVKFHYIHRPSHALSRKFLLHIELLYRGPNLIFPPVTSAARAPRVRVCLP